MAKEIQAAYGQAGRTLYALIRNSTGSVWQTTTGTFVAYATANLANYDVALTEQGTASRFYAGDLPSLSAGIYSIAIHDRLGANPAEGDPLAAMGDLHWNGVSVIARGTLNDDAITAAKIAADAVTEIHAGLSTLNAAGVRAAIGLAAANLDTQLATIDDFLDTEIAAIKAKTDNLPSDPADASDIASSFATVNATLATIAAYIDTEVAAIKAKTDNLPSDPADASVIAASFTTVNTKLDTIDDFLDTEIAAIQAKTDNLPSDPADASVIAASFVVVNAKLDAIDDFVDTEVAAIKAKTDNLPSDPADESSIQTTLATIAAYLDTEIAAIKAKTDNLPASPAATGDAMTLTSAERSTLAAAFLDLTNGIETSFTLRQALRLILSASAAKLSGAASTTVTIRDINNTKDRITATVDSDGNRTTVATDVT